MQEWEKIMDERFGYDNIIALATSENDRPYVRSVNAYYENGSFYIITYSLSDKMKQLEKNPTAAISGEWFTAHGIPENMGFIGKEENRSTADKLRAVFAEWIDNGHVDFSAETTIILRIKLTDGILFSNGKRFDIDFTEVFG
ncbi:pyridoxamine 5'-phosphate oxidase family protein [Huintestinicola sp.]|uniref:pyridoxamine 5'-phosphate oxidase family protein n=1 Tax=Huintestinicola sp. TaxID=2981661 RepID=UPI003D7C5DDC